MRYQADLISRASMKAKHTIEDVPSFWSQALFVVFVFALLLITTYGISFEQSIEWVDANDVYSYLEIARAAPGFPDQRVPYHFSQRFIPHYLVGAVAVYTGLDLSLSYQIANGILLIAALSVTFSVIFTTLSDSWLSYLLFLLISASAYSFRLNLFVPGMLADLVFVFGLAIALRAVIRGSYFGTTIGLFVALCGKQMALLVLPGIFVLLYDSSKQEHKTVPALIRASTVVVVTGLAYLGLIQASSSFALENSITPTVLFSLFPWLLSSSFSIAGLLEHMFRIIMPLMPFFILTLMQYLASRSEKLPSGCSIFQPSQRVLGLLLVAAGPIAYALLPGPAVQMGNQSRYVASVMLPVALITCTFLANLRTRWTHSDAIVLTIAVVLLSYHHRYTSIQATPIVFFITQLVGLALLGASIHHCLKAGKIVAAIESKQSVS
jgi:hypothetical protein